MCWNFPLKFLNLQLLVKLTPTFSYSCVRCRHLLVCLLLVHAWANAQHGRGIAIAGGPYVLGSPTAERDWGYAHSPPLVGAQRWYDRWERTPRRVDLAPYRIDANLVTQADYGAFVRATDGRVPYITSVEYQTQGFLVHPYATVEPYLWLQVAKPPAGLEAHPVVLVNRDDAAAYCAWRGKRLPSEDEWEAACRTGETRRFPWGNAWSAERVHHGAAGTAPAGALQAGATPAGVEDLLGNVFQWTASPFDATRTVLRGCAWDDAPGTCRCAFRHGRPAQSRHVLIGFRCASN